MKIEEIKHAMKIYSFFIDNSSQLGILPKYKVEGYVQISSKKMPSSDN